MSVVVWLLFGFCGAAYVAGYVAGDTAVVVVVAVVTAGGNLYQCCCCRWGQ